MKSITDATRNEVIGKLRICNTDMKNWGLANGYKPSTVRRSVLRYVGTGKKPTGKIALEILAKLAELLHFEKPSE